MVTNLAAVDSRPSTVLVVITGVVALLIVTGLWALTQAAVVIAHEGAHALTASAVGGVVESIVIERSGGGVTTSSRVSDGMALVAVAMAGYVGPPMFGLCGAALLSTGRVRGTLWLSVAFLVCAMFVARRWYSLVTIAATGAVIFLMIRYASDGAQTAFAYTWIWFLLFGGIRSVLGLASARTMSTDTSSDAYHLRTLTLIPAGCWVGFFGLFAFVALVAGGLIMVGVLAQPD